MLITLIPSSLQKRPGSIGLQLYCPIRTVLVRGYILSLSWDSSRPTCHGPCPCWEVVPPEPTRQFLLSIVLHYYLAYSPIPIVAVSPRHCHSHPSIPPLLLFNARSHFLNINMFFFPQDKFLYLSSTRCPCTPPFLSNSFLLCFLSNQNRVLPWTNDSYPSRQRSRNEE